MCAQYPFCHEEPCFAASRALRRNIAAWANAPPFGILPWLGFSLLAEVPAVGLPPIVNAEDTPGLRRVRAEDGLVKSEAVGQGRERNALEVLRVERPEQSDSSPSDMRVRVQLGAVNAVDHPLQE